MEKYLLISLILAVAGIVTAGPGLVRYDDFKVLRISIKNDIQLDYLKKLKNNLPVRYLNEITSAGKSYDVLIDPANQQKLEDQLNYLEMDFEITVPNLQKLLDDSSPKLRSSGMEWTQFHKLQDIYDWIDNLSMTYTSTITPYTIGYSYENRPIKAIKISHKPNNTQAIFIESQMHAIEWISSAASTCFFNNLLHSQNAELSRMLVEYDWIYVPVANPDGFVYTHDIDRLWRKNRKPTGFSNSSGPCYGTDLNRNFGYEWGALSAWNFDVPCDHWYGGAKPDSEPEVQALQSFINSFPDGYIRLYMPFHSYGNLILLPYGHTSTILPPNYEQMMRVAKGFADAARVKYGTQFVYGSTGTINLSGYVSGASKDWVYGVKNVPYTGTMELRDNGTYGFFLPANQIVEVCAEVTDGLIGLIKAAENEEILMRSSAHLIVGSLVNIFLASVIVVLFSRYL